MTLVAAIAITGAGLVTGLLFAFSNCVMQALAELPDDKGMFAMQRVNEIIQNPVFLLLFLGTPVLCAAIVINAVSNFEAPESLLLLAGSLAYLIGPFGITVFFNVPLNNNLAAAEASAAGNTWPDYQKSWLRWNHIRTAIGAVAIFLLAAGLAVG